MVRHVETSIAKYIKMMKYVRIQVMNIFVNSLSEAKFLFVSFME